jgi:hypothetical protein
MARKTGGACYFEVPDRTTLRHNLVRSPPLASETESENLTGISEGARVYRLLNAISERG